MSITAVAREAGVSTSTVSRYLKGELQLRADTEERIRAAMSARGYSAPRREIGMLALIIPELANPYFAQLTQALTDAAHHRGLEVSVFVSDGLESRERAIVAQSARTGGGSCDAAVLVSMTGSAAVLDGVPDEFPFVVLDEKIDGELAEQRPFVGADNFEGAYQATTFLISRGHRRIAHVAGPGRLLSARDRLRGYLQALRDSGLPTDPALVLEGPYSGSFGASALSQVQRLPEPPTAVFAGSDVVAIGIASAAPMHGVRIPEDLLAHRVRRHRAGCLGLAAALHGGPAAPGPRTQRPGHGGGRGGRRRPGPAAPAHGAAHRRVRRRSAVRTLTGEPARTAPKRPSAA